MLFGILLWEADLELASNSARALHLLAQQIQEASQLLCVLLCVLCALLLAQCAAHLRLLLEAHVAVKDTQGQRG